MATSRQPAGHDLVERYFKAMRSGSEALDEMVSLFAPDGEYVEPFSAGGQPSVRRGEAAIGLFSGVIQRSAGPHCAAHAGPSRCGR
jgi:ketosteroid isomerase-like protein